MAQIQIPIPNEYLGFGYAGKSLSEAFIFASANPQYEDRLFIGLNTSSIHGENMLCTEIVLNVKTISVYARSPYILTLEFSCIELVIQ